MSPNRFASMTLCLAGALTATATATQNPFTEDFDADSSSWYDAAGLAPVSWSASGGPAAPLSAHVTSPFDFGAAVVNEFLTVFRAQDEFGSSGGAFEGDWLTDGVDDFSFWVRHDAPVPVNFFARFSSPTNSPAVSALEFVPVLPNMWTEIIFEIDETNPSIFPEGGPGTFDAAFSDIGHVQIGVQVPDALAGGGVHTFDLDKVSIIPAPGGLAALGMAALVSRRRRRR